MSKVEKIEKEELESIQDLVRQINGGQLQIGQLETQKHILLHEIAEIQKGLKNLQQDLEKKYGKVNVSIEDGTITPVEEEEKDGKANT
tara:strand:- start:288 stop:551 length:264 start_codon:yes stop_codon:yes gene_type:complete